MPLAAGIGAALSIAAPVPRTPDMRTALFLLAALGAVLLIDIALLAVWLWRQVHLGKPTFRPTWSLVDFWIAIQLIALLLTLGSIPLFLTHPESQDPARMMSDLGLIVPLLLLQNVAFFLVPAGFVWWKYRSPLRDIGLPPLPRRRDILLGIGLGLAAVVLSMPVEAGLTALAEHYRYLPWVTAGLRWDASQPILPLLKAVTSRGPLVLAIGFLLIGPTPAIGEEMLFRGFLFNLLRKRLGLWPGIVLSGLIFAAVHCYFIGFLPVWILGMCLAYVYWRTGSLWTGILMHATNNGVQVLLAFLFPEMLKS